MIGDPTWDARPTANVDVPTIGVLNGGYSESELRASGAADVFHSLGDLRAALDDTLLRSQGGTDSHIVCMACDE
jgi:phosphoglycolate phosphatase-like HAD superfamily hydrolase